MSRLKLQYILPFIALLVLGLLVAGVFYKQNFGDSVTFPSLGDQESSFDCKSIDRDNLVVILAVGQSIASNFGSVPHTPGPKVFSFYNGRCFHGDDPLPGADGSGGSIWSRLGDLLIERGLAKNVLLVAVGSGGSSVSEWVPDGKFYPRLLDATSSLKKNDLKPNLALWLQGSRDRQMEPALYRDLLQEFIYAFPFLGIQLGQPTRMLVATHTRCKSGTSPELQAAQRSVIDPGKFIFAGPNMDVLEDDKKYDGCHYNNLGLNTAAKMWLEAIEKAMPPPNAFPLAPTGLLTKPSNLQP